MGLMRISILLIALLCLLPHPESAAASCESLSSLKLQNATITIAHVVNAGEFKQPAEGPQGNAPDWTKVPAFCRVAATLRPTSDSDIKIEVWMPVSNWNGKLQGVGNGGWQGFIMYGPLGRAVAAGYAGASTDTGHTGATASFALNHPEKVIDFGYRAVHEMTVQSKFIISAFYGAATKQSLWVGCSQGGRQGVTEAMRYPADYDAIVVGAPSLNRTLLNAASLRINQIAHKTAAGGYIPAEKHRLIHDAVLKSCDAIDSVTDGVLEDPRQCRFDPKVLECQSSETKACLTREQVETARALYRPIKDEKTGGTVFPEALLPGTELGWSTLAGPEPHRNAFDGFKYVIFEDPNWDFQKFDFSRDTQFALAKDKNVINLTDPNLRPFFARGGKLLIYHGWADPQVPAMNSVKYFNDVVRTVGQSAVGKSIQLYMVPGMYHCAGGPGTTTFNPIAAMESWIDTGQSPSQINASHLTDGKVDRTRPLCPIGQVAKWNGTGSTDDAKNFACSALNK